MRVRHPRAGSHVRVPDGHLRRALRRPRVSRCAERACEGDRSSPRWARYSRAALAAVRPRFGQPPRVRQDGPSPRWHAEHRHQALPRAWTRFTDDADPPDRHGRLQASPAPRTSNGSRSPRSHRWPAWPLSSASRRSRIPTDSGQNTPFGLELMPQRHPEDDVSRWRPRIVGVERGDAPCSNLPAPRS
jgi:hypothetical protein